MLKSIEQRATSAAQIDDIHGQRGCSPKVCSPTAMSNLIDSSYSVIALSSLLTVRHRDTWFVIYADDSAVYHFTSIVSLHDFVFCFAPRYAKSKRYLYVLPLINGSYA